jgi:hypothetical protein
MFSTSSSSNPNSPKHPVLSVLLALAIVLPLFVLLALTTFSKTMAFDGACETFPVPMPLTMDLVLPGTTVIAAVDAIAFNGDAHAAALLFDSSGTGQVVPVSSRAFQLKANTGADQSRSGLRIKQFKDTFGSKTQLEVSPPAVLKSTGSPGQAPKLLIEGVEPGGAKLSISAMQMELEGNDYVLSGLVKQVGTFKDFKVVLQSGGVILQPGPQLNATATLTFQTNPGAVLLPTQPFSGATVSLPVRLTFGGCMGAKVQMDGKTLEGVTSDSYSTFELLSDSGKLDELSIMGGAKEPGAPTLHVKATAITKSLMQNRRNLVPNVIQEATADPFATRNLWAPILIGVAWIMFEVLKRVANKVLDATIGK